MANQARDVVLATSDHCPGGSMNRRLVAGRGFRAFSKLVFRIIAVRREPSGFGCAEEPGGLRLVD